MKSLGIDFGTSTCSAATYVDDNFCLVELDPDSKDPTRIRSSIFALKTENKIPDPQPHIVDQYYAGLRREHNKSLSVLKAELDDVNKRLKNHPENESLSLLAQSAKRNIELIENQLKDESVLRTQATRLATQDQFDEEESLSDILANDQIFFGEKGFYYHVQQDSFEKGMYFSSPKNFLGAKLEKIHLETFEKIVTRLLAHIKYRADRQFNHNFKNAIIARPVVYHGASGNEQAISLMKRAAAKAGFDNVDFIMEPIAAAMHIETKLDEQSTVIIVDIGGGTTDITVCDLNPSKISTLNRDPDIHSIEGLRKGGIEVDKLLGKKSLSPHFGRGSSYKDGFPIENRYFAGLFAVDDINELNSFYSNEHSLELASKRAQHPELLERLLTAVHDRRVFRLTNSVEMSKVLLSQKPTVTLPLNYIEQGFSVDMCSDDLHQSLDPWFDSLFTLTENAICNSEVQPSKMLLTGGMSKSPVVYQEILKRYPHLNPERIDEYSSIVLGATRIANQLFK
jgi:hypothetical chaperone protein